MTPAADREMAERLLRDFAAVYVPANEVNIGKILSLINAVRGETLESAADAASPITDADTGYRLSVVEERELRKMAAAARELAKSESKAGR